MIQLHQNAVASSFEEGLVVMGQAYETYITPMDTALQARLFTTGKAIYRAAIAGVDLPGLTAEQNEEGCFDFADENEKLGCLVTKSVLVDDAIELWGEKVRAELKEREAEGGSPFNWCPAALYETLDSVTSPDQLTFDTVRDNAIEMSE